MDESSAGQQICKFNAIVHTVKKIWNSMHLAEPGLMGVGMQAYEMQVKFEMFKAFAVYQIIVFCVDGSKGSTVI